MEQGINTLVLPTAKEDEGWKKIKRVKVRFELFQRLNDTVEPLIGRINNDPDGRMFLVVTKSRPSLPVISFLTSSKLWSFNPSMCHSPFIAYSSSGANRNLKV